MDAPGRARLPERLPERLGVAWVVSAGVCAAVVGLASPSLLLRSAAKEAAVEAVSHGVLVFAAASWVLVRIRGGRGALWIAAACLVIFLEEVDWGAHLGFPGLGAALGLSNLHNSLGGASYLLFALPWVWLYGRALRGASRPDWIPPRADGVAFGLIVAVAAVSVATELQWQRALDELSELMLYGLIVISGLRGGAPEPRL